MEKLRELHDAVKVGAVAVAVISGATATTMAVRANTAAVEALTSKLENHHGRISALEEWKIRREAYEQAVKDLRAPATEEAE